MSLSTHVLDAATGRPAAGIRVRMESHENGAWVTMAEAATDADGRIREFTEAGPRAGMHRLVFDTAGYFDGTPSFYPEVAVTFQVTDSAEHHHVPLLLSPFAYSTYRGS
ncbi:MAG: hydroxyisourate hydrolase [Actinophytocola sp.]|nr:hydroxyisourate hydrolase [Actinophytocola sp.]